MKYNEIVFLGEGATKFKGKLQSKLVRIDDVPLNSSLGMVNLTYQKYLKENLKTSLILTLFYFKDFQST